MTSGVGLPFNWSISPFCLLRRANLCLFHRRLPLACDLFSSLLSVVFHLYQWLWLHAHDASQQQLSSFFMARGDSLVTRTPLLVQTFLTWLSCRTCHYFYSVYLALPSRMGEDASIRYAATLAQKAWLIPELLIAASTNASGSTQWSARSSSCSNCWPLEDPVGYQHRIRGSSCNSDLILNDKSDRTTGSHYDICKTTNHHTGSYGVWLL